MKLQMTQQMVLAVGLALWPPAVLATVVNGDFESGGFSPEWEPHGRVSREVDADTNNAFALFQESDGTAAEGQGSFSQIRQDFTVSTPASAVFSFRYRFIHAAPAVPSTRPPDSFTAFLLNQGDNSRLVGQSGDAPNLSAAFTRPLLYMDTNGVTLLESSYVSLTPIPDAEGFHTAIVNVSNLSGGEEARVIFALNGSENGIKSVLIVDGEKVERGSWVIVGAGGIAIRP